MHDYVITKSLYLQGFVMAEGGEAPPHHGCHCRPFASFSYSRDHCVSYRIFPAGRFLNQYLACPSGKPKFSPPICRGKSGSASRPPCAFQPRSLSKTAITLSGAATTLVSLSLSAALYPKAHFPAAFGQDSASSLFRYGSRSHLKSQKRYNLKAQELFLTCAKNLEMHNGS
jgi:hypothetical protein